MPNIITANLTALGVAAKAATDAGQQLIFTRVAVGSGTAADPINITALVDYQMNLTPVPPQVSVNNVQAGQSMVLVTLDSANAPTTPFKLTEMGVFAQVGGGSEFLYAYFQCLNTVDNPADTIVYQTGLSRTIINLQLPCVIGQGAVLANTLLPSSPLYIPPVKSPDGTVKITTPLDGSGRIIEWDLSIGSATIQKLTQPLTLYVSPGGNDTTAQPNNLSLPWATPQAAHDYLLSYLIPPSINVTIQLLAGVWNLTSALCFDHPQSNQIILIGTVGGIANINSCTISGRTVKLLVSSTFGILVGDPLLVTGNNPNNATGMGIYTCTAVDSTHVSYQLPQSGITFNPSDLAGMTVRSLKSQLVCTAHKNAVETGPCNEQDIGGICTAGNGVTINSVAIVGAGTGGGNSTGVIAGVGVSVYCQYVGAINFTSNGGCGFAGYDNSSIILNYCAATASGGLGLFAQYGVTIKTYHCSFNFCNAIGMWISNGSSGLMQDSWACYNQKGIEVDSSDFIIGPSCQISNNVTRGLHIDNNASIEFGSVGNVWIQNNNTDIWFGLLSSAQRNSVTLNYSTCNISTNSLSAAGSYFAV